MFRNRSQLKRKLTLKVDIRGRPLMIWWGGPEELFDENFFFPRNCFREIIFFSRRLPKNFFFFEEASPKKCFPIDVHQKIFFPYISLLKKGPKFVFFPQQRGPGNFFFSGWDCLKFFFPGEWPPKIFFFPEKGRENFFFSISSGPPPDH